MISWIAGAAVPLDEDELHGARRRAMLLLAAGGDPHRALELDSRAVAALADELDRPERRAVLAASLEELRGAAGGLAVAGAALDALLADGDLAWRGFAAGLLGEELAED